MTGFALAGPEEDDEIADLLAGTDLPGWVSLSYRAAAGAHGMPHPRALNRTLVARGPAGLAGMVTRSDFPGYLGGAEVGLSYLGHFRVAPAARRRVRLLRDAFDAYRATFTEAGEGWSFASLLDGNAAARRLLTCGLPGFPRFQPLGGYVSLVLRCGRLPSDEGIGLARPEEAEEVGAVIRAGARTLAPVLEVDDLIQGRWPGLGLGDVLVARSGGRIVGAVALWDQRSFRQMVVTGYRRPLGALRWAVNALAPVTRLPRLPPVGAGLAVGYLSFLTAPDEAVAQRLIRAARGLAAGRGLDGVALGLAAADPLLPRVRRAQGGTAYGSCIYAVTWQDGTRLPAPYLPTPDQLVGLNPEIGLL